MLADEHLRALADIAPTMFPGPDSTDEMYYPSRDPHWFENSRGLKSLLGVAPRPHTLRPRMVRLRHRRDTVSQL